MMDLMVRTGEGLGEGRWGREAEVQKKKRGDLEEGGTKRQEGEGSSPHSNSN